MPQEEDYSSDEDEFDGVDEMKALLGQVRDYNLIFKGS